MHAGNDVADGDVGRTLGMLLPGNHLVGRRPLGAQHLVEPVQDRYDRGVLVAKPLEELHGERVGQGAVAQAPHNLLPRLRLPAAETQQPVRQLVGPGPRLAGADDELRQPPQVLHQGHPEVDGDRPPLADGQRLNALVGADELSQGLQLKPAVGVGDVGPGQPVDAGVSHKVTLRDLGQQTVIALREVVPDVPDLFVDDVEVVEEPLRGRRDFLLLPHRLGNVPVGGEKDPCVVVDPGEEIHSLRRFLRRPLGRSQALGVLLQALHAEDLGSDRLVHMRRRHDGVSGAHAQLSFRLCLTGMYLPRSLLEFQSQGYEARSAPRGLLREVRLITPSQRCRHPLRSWGGDQGGGGRKPWLIFIVAARQSPATFRSVFSRPHAICIPPPCHQPKLFVSPRQRSQATPGRSDMCDTRRGLKKRENSTGRGSPTSSTPMGRIQPPISPRLNAALRTFWGLFI